MRADFQGRSIFLSRPLIVVCLAAACVLGGLSALLVLAAGCTGDDTGSDVITEESLPESPTEPDNDP